MSATITTVQKVGALAWKYTWSGTAPFTGYSLGQAIFTDSDLTGVVLQHTTDTPENRALAPVLEVIDSTQDEDDVQQLLYPPGVEIQFRGKATTSYYKVEMDGGDGYETITTINEVGDGYYQFTTRALAPGDWAFRVTPYDQYGNAGESIALQVFHHCNPVPLALTFSYDAGSGEVTVDAL